MPLLDYFASLNPLNLLKSFPASISQGLIWGIMAIGVYITFRLLCQQHFSQSGVFLFSQSGVFLFLLFFSCVGFRSVL